jgi:hypothetical protein
MIDEPVDADELERRLRDHLDPLGRLLAQSCSTS